MGHETDRQIKTLLTHGAKDGKDWFLFHRQVNIPSVSRPAEVVLMRQSALRRLAADSRDAPVASERRPSEKTAEEREAQPHRSCGVARPYGEEIRDGHLTRKQFSTTTLACQAMGKSEAEAKATIQSLTKPPQMTTGHPPISSPGKDA